MKNHLGEVISVSDKLIEVDFSPDNRVPPPAFGSFIKIESPDTTWYGLVYNARMVTNPSQIKPFSPAQTPGQSDYNRSLNHDLFKTILQIILIGQTDGRRFSVQVRSKPELFQKVAFPNDDEIHTIALHLDFITNISLYDGRIPAEQLMLTVLRRLMTFENNWLTAHTQKILQQLQNDKHLTLSQMHRLIIKDHPGDKQ